MATSGANSYEATVTTLDGRELRGRVVGWNEQQLVVETADGLHETGTDNLISATWSHVPSPRRAMIELTDGTKVVCNKFSVVSDIATVGLELTGGMQSLPRSVVRRIEMSPLADGLDELWREFDEKQLVGDILVVKKRPSGDEPPALDYLNGVVQDVGAEKIEFVWDGDPVPVKRDKVAAIGFFRANKPPPTSSLCKISTRDGSLIVVQSLQLNRRALSITTPAGLEIQAPLEELRSVDYSNGKLAYLSDLKPLAVKWTPYIGLPDGAPRIRDYGLPRDDQSFQGSALTLAYSPNADSPSGGIKTYRKGLAIRSRTELVYRIPAQMSKFAAVAGIDPQTRTQGHVTLEIFADRSLLWQGEIAGSEPAKDINVSIEGAGRLRILVDYGENLDFGDQLHLADARVTK